jgi:hypothetical protein
MRLVARAAPRQSRSLAEPRATDVARRRAQTRTAGGTTRPQSRARRIRSLFGRGSPSGASSWGFRLLAIGLPWFGAVGSSGEPSSWGLGAPPLPSPDCVGGGVLESGTVGEEAAAACHRSTCRHSLA